MFKYSIPYRSNMKWFNIRPDLRSLWKSIWKYVILYVTLVVVAFFLMLLVVNLGVYYGDTAQFGTSGVFYNLNVLFGYMIAFTITPSVTYYVIKKQEKAKEK